MSRSPEEIVDLAWKSLPATHRALLEAIGCEQAGIVGRPLGQEADDLLRSAGLPRLSRGELVRLDRCLGVWVPDLRITLINSAHDALRGLDDCSLEAALARVAWHEWGHALSVHRTSKKSVAAGPRLLELAPRGVAENVRSGGYRDNELTHELVAEMYAILLARRQRGSTGQPEWLDDEIWNLVTQTMAWAP
jgi:hypothetical protein